MSNTGGASRAPEVVRQEAIAWLVRLQATHASRDDAAFEDWYAAHPDHAAIYDSVLDNWERMEALGTSSTVSTSSQPSERHLQRRGMALIAASIALIVLSLAGLYGTGFFDRTDPGMIASRTGEIQTVQLSDGSRITLDTNSAVHIAFSQVERRLTLLRGRARFTVAHDVARPFIVSAGAGEVVAHGTVFDIDRRANATIVSLWQGAVEVKRLAVTAKGQWLRPGQSTILDAVRPMQRPTFVAADSARWPSGMLTFRDAAVRDVVREANLYAVHPITLGDPAIGALRFSGSFKASDTPALARILADTFALTVSQDARGDFVLNRAARQKTTRGNGP